MAEPRRLHRLPTRQLNGFEELREFLLAAADLRIPITATFTSCLTEDLSWDSLDLAIVLDLLERLNPAVPIEALTELRTLGDLHALFVSYAWDSA